MKHSTELKIGIIMTVSIALFIWLYNYMKGLNLLKPISSYYVVYNQINGLHESNPVYINGYKTGLVDNIDFAPDESGRIVVKFTMEQPFKLPKGSVAQIYSADIMGTQALRILLGKSNEYLHSGDTLPGSVEGSLQEQVSAQVLPIKVKAEELMASFDSVLAVIQVTFNENFRNNFNKSFEDIRLSVRHLKNSSYTVDTLLTNENGQFSATMSNMEQISFLLKKDLIKLDYVLDNISEISDSLTRSEIKSTINNLNETLAGTSVLMAKINNGEGSLGKLTTNDSLYQAIIQLTHRLDTLVNKITENPKKYIRLKLF
ncbi:MAG: MCE family protein [Bacteroidales bacterium]|nr:MCE family protein [Bacteroidales bacterium]